VLLSELIQEDLIRLGMEANDKWEAIEVLTDLLVAAHEIRLTDRGEVLAAVTARERSLSTGLERGLAVPHGACECVSDIIACLGVSRAGIPFESLDGEPAHLIVLLVIPKGTFQRHVRTLAAIARLASTPELRRRIIEAASPGEVTAAIHESELSAAAGPAEETLEPPAR
jgi:mannitol/fructose-specific phosphotransferase system IIA component (Ntr-type)